jgi:hypothetical protein
MQVCLKTSQDTKLKGILETEGFKFCNKDQRWERNIKTAGVTFYADAIKHTTGLNLLNKNNEEIERTFTRSLLDNL